MLHLIRSLLKCLLPHRKTLKEAEDTSEVVEGEEEVVRLSLRDSLMPMLVLLEPGELDHEGVVGVGSEAKEIDLPPGLGETPAQQTRIDQSRHRINLKKKKQ